MKFSPLYLVRQNFPDRSIPDIPAAVRKELASTQFASKLKPGARVAIGVGSRGITNIATIVRSVVDYWKSQGMRPFIFPRWEATARQPPKARRMFSLTTASSKRRWGAPIVSSLDVVGVGTTPEGIKTFMDRSAYESDGVMLVARVKWHTDFAGKIESGLFKMMAIGLGKFAGAQHYHTYAYKKGLEAVIQSIGRQVLASGKILGGLAILEDANHNTGQLTAVPVEIMEKREQELLALVKSWMGKIPMDLDILILDEIGKTISGAGMDTKVVNRGVHGQYNPWPDAPIIERIFLRDLSSLSYGNAVGLGMADVISDRLLNKVDWTPTRINSLTASTPAAIRTPAHFPSDRECLERIAPTVGKLDTAEVTIGWIKNSLELGTIALSENLLPQIKSNKLLEIMGPAREFEFDSEGNLEGLPVEAHKPAQVG